MKRVLLAALLVVACASGPAVPPLPAGPPPAWPPAPARPQVRFVATFPPLEREPVQRPFWTRVWRAIVGLGAERSEGPLLQRPFGIAPEGDRLLVADPDGHRVLRVDWRTGAAEPVTCPDKEWVSPMAVAAGESGAVWVADAGAHALVEVAQGRCRAVGADILERPTAVVVKAGRVYTVDPPRHQVLGFSPSGKLEVRLGGRGDADGQLNFPTALAVLGDGTLLVVDSLNFRVARFAADGRWLQGFGTPGDGGGAFGRPKAVAADAQGRVYVTDTLHDVVVVFSPEGDFQLAFGGRGGGPGSLTLPAGVAIASGHVFVADSFNQRVQVYQLIGAEP